MMVNHRQNNIEKKHWQIANYIFMWLFFIDEVEKTARYVKIIFVRKYATFTVVAESVMCVLCVKGYMYFIVTDLCEKKINSPCIVNPFLLSFQVYSASPEEFGQDSPRYTSPKPGLYGEAFFMGKANSFSMLFSFIKSVWNSLVDNKRWKKWNFLIYH